MKQTLCSAVLLLASFGLMSAQSSGPQFQKAAVLQGNRVQTVFGNWGVIGQPDSLGRRGAWIYPTNGYIGDLSIFVGLEFPIRDYNGDGLPDTVHSVITCQVDRPTQLRDADPLTGAPWTFEPEAGFDNISGQLPAVRSDKRTWPSVWPDHPEWGAGHWNGLLGPDSLAGDDETFFRMDDQNDQRFNIAANNTRGIAFHPDSTNASRTGQGITVSVRYIESNVEPFRNIFYRVYDITNTGTTDYSKVVLGTLTGTYIGITSTEDFQEWSNDAAVYFPAEDFILAWNFPGNAMMDPYWVGPVGEFGEALVESPAGDHIASCDVFAPSSQIVLGSDEDLWNRLLPGYYAHPLSVIDDTVAMYGEDMDYMYGTGYFSLKAGETKRIVAVIAYGYGKGEIQQKILLARALWNSKFRVDAVSNSVAITNFTTHTFLSGMQTIEWSTKSTEGTVSIWYSPDAGANWMPVLSGVPNTGSASWSTANTPDAAFGLLRMFAYDSAGKLYAYSQCRSYFTVDNPGNGVPFVRIMDSTITGGTTLPDATYRLPLLIGDPEWGSLNVTVLYRTGEGQAFVPFETFSTPSALTVQRYSINLAGIPNASSMQLKVVVSDGVSASSDSTLFFNKQTTRATLPAGRVRFSGLSHVPLSVTIKDSAALRADTYVVTFDDTAFSGPKTFSVWDSTRHAWVIKGVDLVPGIESAEFDGLTLKVSDITTVPDPTQTRWNRNIPGGVGAPSVSVVQIPLGSILGYRQPYDYRIVYADEIVDTTVYLQINQWLALFPTPVNFAVYNIETNKKVKVASYVQPGAADLFFMEDVCGKQTPTWNFVQRYSTLSADSLPHAGDTAYIFTDKGLSIYDTLTVWGIISSVNGKAEVPASFALYQNYPNPFNPSTRIDYDLATRARVTLRIFNILGQEVAQLIDEPQLPGRHSVNWDGHSARGQSLASGAYFCRIEAQGLGGKGMYFTRVVKMVYLK
ncbi:MAG TPA: FlgD immunoglobulin-like domain containing protein [Bacteroidota bacterium]|nr:FlgD immunoglobulin-like domain containing protein [Bacteroidota bacterium]